MRRLARIGHPILYIETLGTRKPQATSGADWSRILRRLLRVLQGLRRRQRRLWTLSPLVRPSWSPSFSRFLNRTAFRAQTLLFPNRFREGALVWVYSPYAIHLLEILRPRAVLYHMVDDLAAVPGVDPVAIRAAEARLLSRADLVICTERSLYERAAQLNPNTHLLPNVADFAHFSQPIDGDVLPEPVRQKFQMIDKLPHPRLLFSGHLAPHKVDFALLLKLAQANPAWQIILVGPQWEGARPPAALNALLQRPNVHTTGHVPYAHLPAFLHAADVLLIPYLKNDVTRAVSPLKLFEYLATGHPVVATPLPSLLPYEGVVELADGAIEWQSRVRQALANPGATRSFRIELASRQTWERRIEEIQRLMESLPVSIKNGKNGPKKSG